MTNPLTLIEQADKRLAEIEHLEGCSYYGDIVYECDCPRKLIPSHIHQLLLSIAEGEVAEVGKLVEKHKEQACVIADSAEYDPTNMVRPMMNPLIRQIVFTHIDVVRELSHSLEHWKEIISYLEKK